MHFLPCKYLKKKQMICSRRKIKRQIHNAVERKRIIQVENLASLNSTLKRWRGIEVQRKLRNLIIQFLQRRKRIHTTPWHIPSRLLNFQIKLFSILQPKKINISSNSKS